MTFDYAGQIGRLNDGQRLTFYEVFAHQLTIAVRGVGSDRNFADSEVVAQLKALNEILHRVTARVLNLRRGEDMWDEVDFYSFIKNCVCWAPAIEAYVEFAMRDSFGIVTGRTE